MSPLVEARAASVESGGALILSGVAFAAGAGEFIGVIGPNGAGKTTLLRAVAGIQPVAVGECALHGSPVTTLTPIARARGLAYLPQVRPIYWSMTVEAIVALGRFAYGSPSHLSAEDAAAVTRAIEATGVAHLRGRSATELSGGETARVHLARALAAETPVLLADEPTAALDPRHQLAIMKALRARADAGRLVIAALHDVDLVARFCTRILLLESGRLTADGAAAAVLTAENLSRAFAIDTAVASEGGRLAIAFGA